MGFTATGQIIVLSTLVVQILSAPNGCIEHCSFYRTSSQGHHASNTDQDHVDLAHLNTNLSGPDYNRPGNWTEHNQYRTDDGHGKVHEERGQYVDGSKRMRYYRKNFTSSYNTANVNGAGVTELDELVDHKHDSIYTPSRQQYFNSERTQEETSIRESEYNRVSSPLSSTQQIQSLKTINGQERLEDFGEHTGFSQVNRYDSNIHTRTGPHYTETNPGNWSKIDSYRTDEGRGQVFQEEGQYVTGPTRVRYYKKNYTSSSSTPDISQTSATLQDLHNELQRNMQKDFDSFRREFHQTAGTADITSTIHRGSTDMTQQAVGYHDDHLQTTNSGNYRQELDQRNSPSTENLHHYTDQQQREIFTDTRQQLPRRNPSSTMDTYGTESQRTYQSQETYRTQVNPEPSYVYTRVPNTRNNYQTNLHNAQSSKHVIDESQHTEFRGTHQSGMAQNQVLTENSQRVYEPIWGHRLIPNRRSETKQYEERWSSSSHTGRNLTPERLSNIVHDTSHSDERRYNMNTHNEQQERTRQTNSHIYSGENSYNSAYRTNSGQLVTGVLDLGQIAKGADCSQETHQQQKQFRYKRDNSYADAKQTVRNKNLMQQEFNQQVQQSKTATDEATSQPFGKLVDMTQQSTEQLQFEQQPVEDLTMQTEQFLHNIGNQQLEDFAQQTIGKLEFGQQAIDNHPLKNSREEVEQFAQHAESDDFTHQTVSKLEFEQKAIDNHRSKNSREEVEHFAQDTESDDFTQQTNQFGTHNIHNQKLGDFTQETTDQFGSIGKQQLEDFEQETVGKLEFGQPDIDNHRLKHSREEVEQFAQHAESDDFTQQTTDQFGRLSIGKQQLEDFEQGTVGKLEFGQPDIDNHHLKHSRNEVEQFAQQAESDDFIQQTTNQFGTHNNDNQKLEDFTQQTGGKFLFGQQITDNHRSENLRKGTEQFAQHAETGDFTQQTTDQFGRHSIGKQQLEDFEQGTVGKLEFGQPDIDNHRLKHSREEVEQFAQHAESEDFTQQTTDQFGRHSIGTQQLEDFEQETVGKLKFGKPDIDNHRLKHSREEVGQFAQHAESDDFAQQTTDQFGRLSIGKQQLKDFEQETIGKLEFGQPDIDNHRLKHSREEVEQFAQHAESDDFIQQTTNQFGTHNNDNQKLEDFTQQTGGKFLFGQQITDNHRSENLRKGTEQFAQHAETGDFTQQTTDQFGRHSIGKQQFEDFKQGTVGKLEFGQPDIDNHRLKHSRRNKDEQFAQHAESDDFTQQTTDQFGRHNIGKQQVEDFEQETVGKLEFGQPDIDNHRLKHSREEVEQFAQHAESDDVTQQTTNQFGTHNIGNQKLEDFTQQTVGKLEFGQQVTDNYRSENLRKGTEQFAQHAESGDFTQHNTDQFGRHDIGNQQLDFTQQTRGHLIYEQEQLKESIHKDQHPEKLSQQEFPFDDWTSSKIEESKLFEQQTQQQYKPDRIINIQGNDQFSEDFTHTGRFDDSTQQTLGKLQHFVRSDNEWTPQEYKWNTDSVSQQSHQYPFYNINNKANPGSQYEQISQKNDFNQDRIDHDQRLESSITRPAPKPKLRPRYHRLESIPSHTGGENINVDNISKLSVTTIETDRDSFDKEITQLHDSDTLTYPKYNDHSSKVINVQDKNTQHVKPFDSIQQETPKKHELENIYQNSPISEASDMQDNKYDQQSETFQQTETNFNTQFDVNSDDISKVNPLQHNENLQQESKLNEQSTQIIEQAGFKTEPRILEAYGGGPYGSRNNDIYNKAKLNPSATLPPIDGEDSWDIREKPREIIIPRVVLSTLTANVPDETTTEVIQITTQMVEATTNKQAPRSFWNRIGHKITNTYDKAKEKANQWFG